MKVDLIKMRAGVNSWKFFLIGGSVLLSLYLLHLPAILESALLIGTSLVATIVMTIGLRTYRPFPLLAWIFVSLGQALNTLGNTFHAGAFYLGLGASHSILSIVFYSLGTGSFLTGLAILFTRFKHLIQKDTLVHGLVIATGLSTVIWIFLIAPNLDKNLNLVEWIGIVGYPLGILVIMVVSSIFFMTTLGNTWSYRFLYATTLLYAVGVYFYGKVLSSGMHYGAWPESWLIVFCDASYSIAYLLLGAAFLHPSIGSFRNRLPVRKSVISIQELIILGTAFFIGPLLYLVQYLRGVKVDVIFVLASMFIIFILVETRLSQLVRALEVQNHQLRRQQEKLHHQAYHDSLTGLPNRFYLYTHFPEVVNRAYLSGRYGAMLMIDLNQFKLVNDNFGHDQGDMVLREISGQMMRMKRKDDLIFRWGGDEFVFILEELRDVQDAMAFARRLCNEVSYIIEQENLSVMVTLSIGICLFPFNREHIDLVLKRADDALYHAKHLSAERIAIYPENGESALVEPRE